MDKNEIDIMTASLSVVNNYINANPKNARRTRNKIVVENDSFELIFDNIDNKFDICKKDDLFYSIIPYDTAKKYIQKAAYLYLIDSVSVDEYIKKHEKNICKYIALSLFEVTGKKYKVNSSEVKTEFEKIMNDNYSKFKLQEE